MIHMLANELGLFDLILNTYPSQLSYSYTCALLNSNGAEVIKLIIQGVQGQNQAMGNILTVYFQFLMLISSIK